MLVTQIRVLQFQAEKDSVVSIQVYSALIVLRTTSVVARNLPDHGIKNKLI